MIKYDFVPIDPLNSSQFQDSMRARKTVEWGDKEGRDTATLHSESGLQAGRGITRVEGIAGKDGHGGAGRAMHYGQRRPLQTERSITGREGHYRQRRESQVEMGIAGRGGHCMQSEAYRAGWCISGREGHRRQIVPRRQRGIAGRNGHCRQADRCVTDREWHYRQREAYRAGRGIAGR